MVQSRPAHVLFLGVVVDGERVVGLVLAEVVVVDVDPIVVVRTVLRSVVVVVVVEVVDVVVVVVVEVVVVVGCRVVAFVVDVVVSGSRVVVAVVDGTALLLVAIGDTRVWISGTIAGSSVASSRSSSTPLLGFSLSSTSSLVSGSPGIILPFCRDARLVSR